VPLAPAEEQPAPGLPMVWSDAQRPVAPFLPAPPPPPPLLSLPPPIEELKKCDNNITETKESEPDNMVVMIVCESDNDETTVEESAPHSPAPVPIEELRKCDNIVTNTNESKRDNVAVILCESDSEESTVEEFPPPLPPPSPESESELEPVPPLEPIGAPKRYKSSSAAAEVAPSRMDELARCIENNDPLLAALAAMSGQSYAETQRQCAWLENGGLRNVSALRKLSLQTATQLYKRLPEHFLLRDAFCAIYGRWLDSTAVDTAV
jgi:hypothetical protein